MEPWEIVREKLKGNPLFKNDLTWEEINTYLASEFNKTGEHVETLYICQVAYNNLIQGSALKFVNSNALSFYGYSGITKIYAR